ncbi:hypothetical protein JYT61_00175 [bacterium AH-315-E10]|nr:hypothetical protein [bacterium AH-315-E10]
MDRMTIDSLKIYKCLILSNVGSFSQHFIFLIEQFAELGGGVLFALGNNVDRHSYQKLYNGGKGIFPVELLRSNSFMERYFQPSFPAGVGNFILDIFDLSRTRVLNEVMIEKYWRCKQNTKSTAFAFFNDDPFLIYKSHGQGKVIVWTSTLDASWSNLPFTQDYLPLLQNLIVYLSSSVDPPINIHQGDSLLFSSSRPITGHAQKTVQPTIVDGKAYCLVTLPSGKTEKIEMVQDGLEWTLNFKDTIEPGLYKVEESKLGAHYFAVQLPTKEGNLQSLHDDDIDKLNDQLKLAFIDNQMNLRSAIQQEEGKKEWWQKILLFCLFLLCLEQFLSWRFSEG